MMMNRIWVILVKVSETAKLYVYFKDRTSQIKQYKYINILKIMLLLLNATILWKRIKVYLKIVDLCVLIDNNCVYVEYSVTF